MRLKIIGSAAGGGFPQWNCNFRLSRAARKGMPGVRPRTQSSLAVSADNGNWVLFNASPDIREQIAATPELQPTPDGPLRATPIAAVVLTNGEVDHVAGLLSLRERQPFALYAARPVLEALAANPIFGVLDPDVVPRRELAPGKETEIRNAAGETTGVNIEPFIVPGKVPLYLEGDAPDHGGGDGETIAVRIFSDGTGPAFYVPGCAHVETDLKSRLKGARCLMFDGTVYEDDEMIQAGVGEKTGARMGHIAMAGKGGAIASLADVPVERRIFVHINNTNPVLDENSPEHAKVRAAGWEIAFDGMEVEL
jgi:pyrroloquinoline quinone biosynthesis protein B